MPLNFITHQNKKYPQWQAEGNAARWILPLAQYHCIGKGYDIGYSKEAWMLPGAIGIEPSIDAQWDAMKLPAGEVDYIFSSHCLEHVQRNWYDVIDYWLSKIRIGGILFLYLPHASQSYWHPSSNRKHIHSFDGSEIEAYLDGLGHKVYVSGADFNNSFVVICEKVDNKPKFKFNIESREGNPDKIANKSVTGELLYGVPNAHSDVLMHGCFGKSIKDGKFHLDNHDIPTGHYPVKDSLLYGFTGDKKMKPPVDNVFHENKSTDFTDTENICDCIVCKEKFKVGFSRFSDRENKPTIGDMVTCPNCNTMFIFMGEDILYKPNIFNSKSV